MGSSCTKAGREEAAFLKAARDGHCLEVQQAILRDVEWSYKVQTWNGQSVFHLAARYGRLDVLETVVEAVRFNPAGPEKWRKLLRMGHSTDALLRAFANLQDTRCQTPLHLASIYGHADLAERLLQLGSTPWSWDELGGRTPLHYAASMGHVDVIRVIVSHNAPAPTGEALRRPNASRTRLVDICNDSGYTPLHYAVWASNTAAVRALTSYEASLSARNVTCGSDWVVSCLKCTPLHLAAHKGNEVVIKLLLSSYVQSQPPQGAEAPSISDRRHRDPRRHVNANRQLPYHVAVSRNHTRLAEMLHPDVPFSFILTPAEMESRMYGVAKLAVLAARTLQAKLIADIEVAVAAMTAAQARGTASGGGAGATMGRTRSAALSGAVVATAAGQAIGGGAATAQQVLAAATARLRAASVTSIGTTPDASSHPDPAAQPAAVPANGPRSSFQARHAQPQPQQQSLDQVRVLPGRTSHDSTASAPAAIAGPLAVASTAMPMPVTSGKGSGPPSGGSATSDDSGREPLAMDPVPDLTGPSRAPDQAVSNQPQPEPLPLPPAPISPFLPPPATAGATAAGGAPRPPTFNAGASAFALFAAESFDEPVGAGGGQGLQPLASTSVSVAVVARNRTAADVTATVTPPTVASTSINIAALARGIRPGAGNPSSNKLEPSRSRSLRSLLTGGLQRRTNAQQQRGELSAGGDASGEEVDNADDLDAILNAMRPNEDANTAGAVASAAATAAPAAVAGGTTSGDDTAAASSQRAAAPSPPPPESQRSQSASRRGPLNFWRRATMQGVKGSTSQEGTPEARSPYSGSSHGGAQAMEPSFTSLAAFGRIPRASPAASRLPSGAAEVLPPGVVEALSSVEAPAQAAATTIAGAASLAIINAPRSQQPPAPPSPAHPRNSPGDDDNDGGCGPTRTTRGIGLEASQLRRSSISLGVLARYGVEDPASGAEGPLAPAGHDLEGQPSVDGAVLAMLASLVEAPQHVLRRYRLLQLTHGLDLQDMLRDHAELAVGDGGTAAAGVVGSGRGLDRLSRPRSNASELPDWSAHTAVSAPAGGEASAGAVSPFQGFGEMGAASLQRQQPRSQPDGMGGRGSLDNVRFTSGNANGISITSSTANGAEVAEGNPPGSTVLAMPGVEATVPRASNGQGAAASAGSNAAPADLAGQLLRTLSSRAASESGEGMCGVCFDQPDYLRITDCGHRLCSDCSKELCKLNTFKPALCPFCRGVIGGFEYVGR